MEQAHLLVSHELQLNQLPEGTEIQVPRLPLACAYKRQGERWSPIESIPTVYKPLIWDEFPLGSIAIDPEGVIYVKGSGGCQAHSKLGHSCQCTKPVCWLRVSPFTTPSHPGSSLARATQSNKDIEMEDPNEVLCFHANVQHVEPDTLIVEDGTDGHRRVPYVIPSSHYQHSESTGNGHLGVYEVTGPAGHHFAAANGSEDIHRVPQLPVAGNGVAQIPLQSVNRPEEDQLQEFHEPNLRSDTCTIYFGHENNGISLAAIDIVDDKGFSFGPDITLGVKATFRFKFKYWQKIPELKGHVDMRKQVTIRNRGDPISPRAMAALVYSELMAEFKTMAEFDRPLLHGGLLVRIEELVLLRVVRTTRGTLQPLFELRR